MARAPRVRPQLLNIEKHPKYPRSYIGYEASTGTSWRIRRCATGGWVATRQGDAIPTMTGRTLADISAKLEQR